MDDIAMKTSDLSDLRTRIAKIARGSRIGARVKDVVVEADDYGDGTDFLRVVVQLQNIDSVKVEEVQPLVEAIETAVAELDDRFPSVRFAEAA
jgi:hypothetical protein